MPSPNNVLTADSYIQDGIVFQLDGIEYGGRADGWLDRKGGIFFASNNGRNLHQINSFVFSYNNWLQALSTIDLPTNASINIAINTVNSWRSIFWITPDFCIYSNDASNIVFQFANRSRLCEMGNLIASSERGLIHDGRKQITFYSQFYRQSEEFPLVGKWPTFNGYNFTGSIYAIRIYSRQLSDREILINQKIDNARFGLGLNIPDEVLPASRSLSLLEPFELPDESESEQEPTNETSDER